MHKKKKNGKQKEWEQENYRKEMTEELKIQKESKIHSGHIKENN